MEQLTLATVSLEWECPEVALITLNRPDAGNSLSSQLVSDLHQAADCVRFTESAKVLVITGAGRFFCAGADLKEQDRPRSWIWRARAAIDHLPEMEQIVIAAMNGPAMGGGTELALACDLRVATRSAQIGLPEIKFGALPGAGGPQRLARLVGPARAKYLVCSGRALSVEQAQTMGIVDEIADDGEATARAVELAQELAEHAAYALRTAKSVIDRGLDVPLPAALRAEYEAIDGMATPEQFNAEVQKAMARSNTYAKIFASSKESAH